MAKDAVKVKANQIREKYAREYAGKLKAKDRAIDARDHEIQALKAWIEDLEAQAKITQQTIDDQNEIIKKLQACARMSDQELAAFKSDLETQRAGAAAAQELAGMAKSLLKVQNHMNQYF